MFYHSANRCETIQPSNIDLIYKEAVIDAWKSGVEIKTLQVEWNRNGECVFIRNDLPICL